ncbi:MAG: DNA-binding protein [Gaiellales bacterium]|nr:DNA-binding protein [Gaiellales bacterium]
MGRTPEQPLTLSRLQNGERATITVLEFSQLVGISLGSARKAVRAGEVPSLRLGARWLIPVPKLLQMLGAEEDRAE